MNEGLKQRVVGAIVLVCLGLILWPVLFSESNGPALSRQSQIPPAPEFQKYQIVAAKQPANLKPVSDYTPQPEEALEQISKSASPSAEAAVKSTSVNNTQPTSTIKPVPAATNETLHTDQGLPVYWALQVGSFRDKQKAESLKSKLIKQGYKVDTRTVRTSSGESVRVYVGPKLDKRLLKKDQAKIDSKFKVKSMLVRFSQ